MRKLSRFSLGFLFVLISNFSFAQSYIPLVDTNKVWNVVTSYNFGGANTQKYKLGKDTLIDTHIYKEVLTEQNSTWSKTNIAIREDTINQQVFFRKPNQMEYLAYDFSLNEGDTFYFTDCNVLDYMIVDLVDSITLTNGEKRKQIHLGWTVGYPYINWVEGIGGIVLTDFCVSDIVKELLCVEENNELKFKNPNYDTCYYSTVTTNQIINKESVSIYPNPSSNFINIVFESSKNENFVAFQIYDIGGKQVMQNENSLENIYEINLNISNLTQGIYTIVINTNEHNYYEKIIKH